MVLLLMETTEPSQNEVLNTFNQQNPPLWESREIYQEPILLFKNGDYLEGHLLFFPERIQKIEYWDAEKGYLPINNQILFEVEMYENKNRIRFPITPPSSNLPYLHLTELVKPHGSPNSYPSTLDGKNSILHSESGLFHQMQIVVSYRHKELWKGPKLPDQKLFLPVVKNRIENSTKLDIFIFGDSISTGCNASKFMKLKPYNDAYPEILIAEIQKMNPKLEIKLVNEAMGGQTSEWGKKTIRTVLEKHPELGFHLNIIAWGANDAGGKRKPRNYYRNIETQIKQIKKTNPNAEFILVSPLLPNPIWSHAHNDYIWAYSKKLEQKAKKSSQDVAVANVTQIWADITQRKSIYDLIGNGINHPNDFGHRIYAHVIKNCLLK